jgi:hypothetical protein
MKQDSNNSQSSGNSQLGVEKNLKNITTTKSNLPLLTEESLLTIEEDLINGLSLQEILQDKRYPFSLMKFYGYLKKNPELEARILEARKMGVQTLIDKLMQVFSLQEIESPNQILWIREKSKWVQWLASKITDLYSDSKPQQIKQDQNITIRFESGIDEREIIELDPEKFEFTPGPNSTIKKD